MKEKLPLFYAAIFYHLGRSLARRWNVGRPFSWTASSVGSVGLPWPSRDFVLLACAALANRTQHHKAVILWCMFIKFYTHEWSNKWVLRWSPHTPKRVQKWAMPRGTLKESGVAFFLFIQCARSKEKGALAFVWLLDHLINTAVFQFWLHNFRTSSSGRGGLGGGFSQGRPTNRPSSRNMFHFSGGF